MFNLLMVDDNPADIEMLHDAIKEAGIKVELMVAENGMRALAVLEKIINGSAPRPAVIILDLNMPQMDGRDLLAFIKGGPDIAMIPTIVLTSSSSPQDRKECLDLGAEAYFTKPNTIDDLDKLVRNIERVVTNGLERKNSDPRPPYGGCAFLNLGDLIRFWRAATA
jgi:CheY-like chemotaxis protein